MLLLPQFETIVHPLHSIRPIATEGRLFSFSIVSYYFRSVGIPALLDVEDMIRLKKPEPRSVQCYVQMIFSKYRPKDMDMSNLIIA